MKNLHTVLTDAERERVAFLNLSLERKPADAFLAGEFFKLEGSQKLGNGRSLGSGVYCVIHWRPDGLEVMPYGKRTKIQVPFGWTGGAVREFSKVPLELVVLSERAKQRAEAVA
jgi:hypothetical protein